MNSERTPMPEINSAGLAAQIVSAYVSNNHIAQGEVGKLFGTVLAAVESGSAVLTPEPEIKTSPKTQKEIAASITPDALISFIDGAGYCMLRRHLTAHGMTPESYREKFGLPLSYPLTAPAYSQKRAALAKANGLGTKRSNA